MAKEFENIIAISPIDFWENATVAGIEETARVLEFMPEEPRSETVYKTWVPGDTELVPVYMCKASNNGTTYLFCDEDLLSFYLYDLVIVKGDIKEKRIWVRKQKY